LSYIEDDGAVVRIGAMTRQRRLEFDPRIAAKLPLLREALRWIGHLPTRSRGTIGGSIAHADPSAEIPMVMQTLEGEVVARGPQGERRIPAQQLFQATLTTSLAPLEIITEVRLPAMPAQAVCAVEEFARRKGDFAIAAVAVMLMRDEHCIKARLATAGVSPASIRLRDAEAVLEQKGLGEVSCDQPHPDRGRDPRGHFLGAVPLHRLCQHCQGGRGRGGSDARRASAQPCR
jgi:carbon-monoxide dehydrogenase medium subunit